MDGNTLLYENNKGKRGSLQDTKLIAFITFLSDHWKGLQKYSSKLSA
ncbi:hypothetical protein OXIME_001649 [Oxyplasma meridianum]|uniref:Transposase n=1 Tax=Oxyplasma meridianum TaxID=3073602 RepID=A0AAX4NIK4_9ARCH